MNKPATHNPAPLSLEFDAELWMWKGPAPWYFVSVPEEQCHDVRAFASTVTYGWGMIPVQARIGKTHFKTSMWPKDGGYVLPVKASVRKAEGIDDGDVVKVQIELG